MFIMSSMVSFLKTITYYLPFLYINSVIELLKVYYCQFDSVRFDTVAYAAVDFDLRVNGQPCLLVGSRRRLRQDVLSRRGQGVETQHQRGT